MCLSVFFSGELVRTRCDFLSINCLTGLRNRATGSNSINEQSSRSHSMLTLHIDSEMYDMEDDKLCITKHGKLTFVDLAGRCRRDRIFI